MVEAAQVVAGVDYALPQVSDGGEVAVDAFGVVCVGRHSHKSAQVCRLQSSVFAAGEVLHQFVGRESEFGGFGGNVYL